MVFSALHDDQDWTISQLSSRSIKKSWLDIETNLEELS